MCGERERETANIIYKNISKMCAAGYAFYAAYNALIHANRTHTYMIMDIIYCICTKTFTFAEAVKQCLASLAPSAGVRIHP